MIAVGIIVAVLIIIGLIRLGVTAEYSVHGVAVFVKAGPFSVYSIYPKRVKPENKHKIKKTEKTIKTKKRSKRKEKSQQNLTDKFGGSVEAVKKLLPVATKALNKFRKKLCINELVLYYTVASDDPYDTAMRYGELTAGLSSVRNMFMSTFRVKKWDVQTAVDFTITEPVIYIKAKLSLAVWQILAIALGAGKDVLKILIKNNYGKAAK